MFEIGDIVKYRHWTNKSWEEGTYIIIDIELSYQSYEDKYYSYTIQNTETGIVLHEINWQQIEQV